MKLDGIGIFVKDMKVMLNFYKDVLGFETEEDENAKNVYLIKDGTLFMMYPRNSFEQMTNSHYGYTCGVNGHFELALHVDSYEEVDKNYNDVISKGANSIMVPTTMPWGQRTCYVSDPEGNLIEIGSFNKSFR